MSLQSLKNVLVDKKETEIRALQSSHESDLRTLYHLTNLVRGAAIRFNFLHAPPSPDEQRFLDQSSVAKGHRFREEALPAPVLKQPSTEQQSTTSQATTTAQHIPASHVPSPLSPTVDFHHDPAALDAAQLTPASASAPAHPPSKASIPPPHTPPRSPTSHAVSRPHDSGHFGKGVPPLPWAYPDDVKSTPSSSQAAPSAIEQPGNEHKLDFEEAVAEERVARSGKAEPPRDAEHVRGKDRPEVSAAPNAGNDGASSPSSTAGAYSNSTPKPAQHSPDTSPEAETIPHPVQEQDVSPTFVSPRLPHKHSSVEPVQVNATPEAQLRMEEAQAQRPPLTAHRDASQRSEQPKRPLSPLAVDNGDISKVNLVESNGSRPPSKPVEPQPATPQVEETVPKGIATVTFVEDDQMEDVRNEQGSIATSASRGEQSLENPTQSANEEEWPRQNLGAVLHDITKRAEEAKRPSPLSIDTKSRERHSTVVFAKDTDPMTQKAMSNELEGYLALKGASLDPEKDYLRPLFLHQAWGPPRSTYLTDLISKANKTITTSDSSAGIRETVDYKIIRRIYNLQNANKWSLRQMAKFQDPAPQPNHWDFMMDEMKWMRTDFREERRWKVQIARSLASACARYVGATVDERLRLQVKVRQPTVPERIIADSAEGTPELDHSAPSISSDSPSSTTTEVFVAPSDIFNLKYDQVIVHLDQTLAGEALLGELPFYDPKGPANAESSLPLPSNDDIVPVSKLVTGKLVPQIAGPPRKRSRYEFEPSDDEPSPAVKKHRRTKSSDPSPFLSPARRTSPRSDIPPEEQEVALFNPINKHILDRLHTTHAFRPPHEFPMPHQSFFENRPQSFWTWDEDQRLRFWVRRYTYNWSLIAMELQRQCQGSDLYSGAERRTPWECFERWVQLEGLPSEMSKTGYFKVYQQRLDAANRSILAQAQAQAAAQPSNGGGQTPVQANFPKPRRTSHQPVRVERKRDTRHISMLDVFKRVAKKREVIAQRQIDNTRSAAMRKQNQPEQTTARQTIHTPQELSKLRQDREANLRERAEMHRRQQLVEQQRKAMQQVGPPQGAGLPQQGTPSLAGAQSQVQAQAQALRVGAQQQTPATAQAQLAQAAALHARAAANGVPANSNNILNNLVGLSVHQIQALQQAGRLPGQPAAAELARLAALQHQRTMQMQQQHISSQTPGLNANHMPNSNNMPQAQQQMLANIQRANGMVQNSVNGIAGSPPLASATPQGGQFSTQHALLVIQQNIGSNYPHLTQDQVRALASERLKTHLRSLSQSAATAAAGPSATSMQNQSLAQQHLGLHGHGNQQMMAAFAAAQGSMGGASSPGQATASLVNHSGLSANGIAGTSGMSNAGLGATVAVNSPQQMYRNMQINHQARLSGSPGMMPARPDSRSGTPNGMGMVRTASGASGSPTMGNG